MKTLKTVNMAGLLLITLLLIQALFAHRAIAAWEAMTNRPGMDMVSKSFPIDKNKEGFVAVKHCEDACKEDSQCKAFTFVKAGVQGANARCWLKSGVPSPVKNTCCTSGVVRPQTKADYCNNYALDAVIAHVNNINWKCGYSGLRWQYNKKAHYNWCMKVPKKSADDETDERQAGMDKCLALSTSGELAAHDWCWDKDLTTITFYPLIKNGPKKWASNKDGYYKIGLGFVTSHLENKYVLPKWPYFWLEPNETRKLEGFQLPYHDENEYMVENVWMISHPEDTNIGNNLHPGLKGVYKGKDFLTYAPLLKQQCK
jgi:hypothetical protein